MDVGAVDRRRELWDLVESRLVLAPVVVGAPVFGQVFQVRQRHAAGPAGTWYLVGPPGPHQPPAQVGQGGVGEVDPKRSQLGHGVPFSSGSTVLAGLLRL